MFELLKLEKEMLKVPTKFKSIQFLNLEHKLIKKRKIIQKLYLLDLKHLNHLS